MTDTRDRHVAIRQAGHAFMYLVEGAKLDRVSVEDDGTGSDGFVQIADDAFHVGEIECDHHLSIDEIAADLRVTYAGCCAEIVHLGGSIDPQSVNTDVLLTDDTCDILMTLIDVGVALNEGNGREFLQSAMEETTAILEEPAARRTVTALAEALIEHRELAGREAQKIMVNALLESKAP